MKKADAVWVAVIDDDDAIRHSLLRFFKVHGIPAEAYGRAEDYVNRRLGLPGCLVLDVQLQPGMSSFELIDWMNAAGQRVPVIFMTGQAVPQAGLCERYPELRETLHKPFDPDQLIARVQAHLRISPGSAHPTVADC